MSVEIGVEASSEKMLEHQNSAIIWYRKAPGEKIHEFSLETLHQWYENSQILIAAQFSFDAGATWESIIELRRRNGPAFPFVPKNEDKDDIPPGFGSIALARKIVDATRVETERFERSLKELEKEVDEEERMLEKIREMEKELDRLRLPKRDKYAQIEARMFQVTAKIDRKAAEAAATKPQPDTIVLQGGSVSIPEDESGDGKPKECQLVEPQSSTEPDLELEPVRAPSAGSRISVARPHIFPMLAPSTMSNDYAANTALIATLRDKLYSGISTAAKEATANTFQPPPTCRFCEEVPSLNNLASFLDHAISEGHQYKIASAGGKISAAQCFYWLEILQKGYTTRPAV